MWDGGECVIIGGGPSVALVDLEQVRGRRRVIACNDAFRIAPWADVLFFGDCRWHTWNGRDVLEFGGLKVTRCDRLHASQGLLGLSYSTRQPGTLSTDPGIIEWNRSTGAGAINVATLLGVRRIVLLGYDMRRWTPVDTGELRKAAPGVTRHNWHGYHRAKLVEASKKAKPRKGSDPDERNQYGRFSEPFPGIAKAAKRLGVEIVNASPKWKGEHVTRLDAFPVVEPDEVLP